MLEADNNGNGQVKSKLVDSESQNFAKKPKNSELSEKISKQEKI